MIRIEIRLRREKAVRSGETCDLHRDRGERDEVDDPKQPEKDPAGEEIAYGASRVIEGVLFS
jgi:hypothetical protein